MENQNQSITATLERVPQESAFSIRGFAHAQQVAKMLAGSSIVPTLYQGKIENVMIALEFANRIGASPFMVMQNLNIIKGKPSWGSSFIIAALNSCKKFSPLRFEVTGAGNDLSCFAWAFELNTKAKITGPAVSMKMAKAEGWYDKDGSKWKTMPELMIRYRAAAFFGRLYAPELLMGMHSTDEVTDMQPTRNVDAQVIESNLSAGTPADTTASDSSALMLAALQTLYFEKLELLNKKEMDAAKRIIDNKEVASYEKLHKFLTDKQAGA